MSSLKIRGPGLTSQPLTDVIAARRRVASFVRRTPLVHSAWLSHATGAEVYLKLESLQVTNSFKVRGALNAAMRLIERTPTTAGATIVPRAPGTPLRARPPRLPLSVVTASAGNHGRALAYAAETLGIKATVFTPRDAPLAKIEAIRQHGADLHAVADSYDQAEDLAREFASTSGATYLSPYNDAEMIAGAGTIALELVEDVPDLNLVLVPVGGGGLVSGIAATLGALAPAAEVIGVEAEASPAFHTALEEGRPVDIDVRPTLADGLAGNMEAGTMTFGLVQRYVHGIVLVGETDLARGIRDLVAYEHLVAEGAGAVGVAAAVAGLIGLGGLRVVIVVSGANIDPQRLSGVLCV